MIEGLNDNYRMSLSKKYNAICFDIDGTLTVPGTNKIDERVVGMIANLLKGRIPVVFITGRGETGLNDLKEDIGNALINEYKLDNTYLKRMYVLTNDGARLFFTSDNIENSIFNNSVYISDDYKLNQLKIFVEKAKELFNKEDFCSDINISYSCDLNNDTILNVRIIFDDKNQNLINKTIHLVDNIIKDYNLNDIVVSLGDYADKEVLQIGTSKKENAIEETERIIGVPKNSMIRIGDRGDLNGNDFSMLNCEQGFTVDRANGNNDVCFPVLDENGNILKGVEATLYIVNNANLLPTVCLEKAIKKDYIYNYAKVERDILKGRKKLLSVYNEIVNKKFDIVNGINDLFDSESGSIKIPMYEWELIDKKSPLFELWNEESCGSLLYSLRDNNNYLLRGSSTYYYFLANRRSENGDDFTSVTDIIGWYDNNLKFIDKAFKVMHFNYDLKCVTNKKLILGILDNIRNVLLIIINHYIFSKNFFDNVLIKLNSDEDKYLERLYEALYCNDFLMKKMCFENDEFCSEDVLKILELLEKVYSLLNYDYLKFQANAKDIDYSKEFRAYREIDNFAENYIATKLNDDKVGGKSNFAVCGMCYGGLELPIIYKIVNPDIKDVLLLKFNKNVSGYANKQLVELREFDINKFGGLLKIGNFDIKKIVLMDDNVLTGKTIQLATNSLYDENIKVDRINVVRYPSVNRVDQMFLNNHGAVDYNLFFDYITGLCFPSPYSWRDQNSYDLYLDSLGTFDLNRKKIVECIIKNHDYKECSEVNNYLRKRKQ